MTGAGRLSLVATPIGNLEDLTARAVRTLGECGLLLAEDTRRARALLAHLGITGKRVARLDAHVEARSLERWLRELEGGAHVALVSDAGMPTVSDPGQRLVAEAVRAGVEVCAIPGASAVSVALAVSGFPADRYRFFGFLPRKGGARRRALDELRATEETAVFFESPRRLSATLAELCATMGGRSAVVARELTKLHEQIVRGDVASLAARPDDWRGEITVVLGPSAAPAPAPVVDVEARARELRATGLGAKAIARELARETGASVRDMYRLASRRSNDAERE